MEAILTAGAFITIGSDEAGTGLGEWISIGTHAFAFTYLNFHFGRNGSLNNTVKVRARGTFHGSTLTGQATLTKTDAHGKPMAAASRFAFTGKRIAAESP